MIILAYSSDLLPLASCLLLLYKKNLSMKKRMTIMNKTVKTILTIVRYAITLLLGAGGTYTLMS